MEKLIRDGKVAVIISPGWGSGWYSWHGIPELLYDPKVVEMVLNEEDLENILKYCHEKYGDDNYFSPDELEVVWIQEGTKFMVHEYDGSESIRYEQEMRWLTA